MRYRGQIKQVCDSWRCFCIFSPYVKIRATIHVFFSALSITHTIPSLLLYPGAFWTESDDLPLKVETRFSTVPPDQKQSFLSIPGPRQEQQASDAAISTLITKLFKWCYYINLIEESTYISIFFRQYSTGSERINLEYLQVHNAILAIIYGCLHVQCELFIRYLSIFG